MRTQSTEIGVINLYEPGTSEAERLYDLGTLIARAMSGDVRSIMLIDSFSSTMCEVAIFWRGRANRGIVLQGLMEGWTFQQIYDIYEGETCGS